MLISRCRDWYWGLKFVDFRNCGSFSPEAGPIQNKKATRQKRDFNEAMNGWGVGTASAVAAPRRRTLFVVGGLIMKESVTPKIKFDRKP